MTKILKTVFFGIILLSAPSAFATTFRVDPTPVQTVAGNVAAGGFPAIYAVPNATIKLCSDSACTMTATAYTDSTGGTPCPSLSPVTLPGTNVCVSASGGQGQFGFWLNSGTYYFQVTTPNGQTFGPYPLSAPSSGGGVGGSGITNLIPKWTGSTTLGDSALTEAGGTLSIGEPLSVIGTTTLNGQTYTWPASQTASNCLSTNGSGTLSWSACGGSGGSYTMNGLIFANTTSTIASSDSFFWDDTNKAISLQHLNNTNTFIANFTNGSAISGDGNGVEIVAGATSADIVFDIVPLAGGTATMTVLGDGTVEFPKKPLAVAYGGTAATTLGNTLVAYGCVSGGSPKLCTTGSTLAAGSMSWGESTGNLTISNIGSNSSLTITSTGGSANNFGQQILAGSTSGDWALDVESVSLTRFFRIFGDGGISTGTNVSKGINTINSGTFYSSGTAGLTGTATTRNSANSGTCTISFTGGLVTATTC